MKDLALEVAAQCWCDEETQHIVMQPALAEAFAKRLENWMNLAKEESDNTEFYRGLLDEVAQHLGPEVYISEDGSVQDQPLRLKIPGLVAELAQK